MIMSFGVFYCVRWGVCVVVIGFLNVIIGVVLGLMYGL